MLTKTLAALLLLLASGLSAHTAESWKQTAETVYKGHRLAAFLDEASRRGMLKLDDREIARTEAVSEIGKITVVDVESTILFSVQAKRIEGGCGTFVLVSVPAAESQKGDVLADFGACNSKLNIMVKRRKGWGAWYAIAFRDDLATAKLALMRSAVIRVADVKAPPCLFANPVANECTERLVAAAYGSEERGLLTGEGAFGEAHLESYLNRLSGKATIEFNGRALNSFNSASEFYLDSVKGGDEFGLFSFWLKPVQGCSTRPLVFVPTRGSEPQVVADFAPCADQMLPIALKSKSKTTTDWILIAYRVGDSHGFIATVVDRKLTTRPAELPACLVAAPGVKSAECVRQMLAPNSGGG